MKLCVRGRQNDKNYFRKQKTATHNLSQLELRALAWGASCLPDDEYRIWLGTLKPSFNQPLGALYLSWLADTKTELMSKLTPVAMDPD
jgi:hypothetical protein